MIFTVAKDLLVAYFQDIETKVRANEVALATDTGPLTPPYIFFSAERDDMRGFGVALLFGRPTTATFLSVSGADGLVHRVDLGKASSIGALVPKLVPAARLSLIHHMLDGVPRHLRRNTPELGQACREVLEAIGPAADTLGPSFGLGNNLMLALEPPTRRGPFGAAYRIGEEGVRRQSGPVHASELGCYWLVDNPRPGPIGNDLLVVVSATALRWWRLGDTRPGVGRDLFSHIEAMKSDHARKLVRALEKAVVNETAASVRTLVTECEIFFGTGFKGADGKRRKAFAYGIDALVPVAGGGAFVKGWLFDPTSCVASVAAIDAVGRRIPVPTLWPVLDAEASKRWRDAGLPAPARAGFVGYVEGGVDGPWEFEVELRSGARFQTKIPEHQRDPRRARDELLASVTASAEIDGAVRFALAPAIERLHAAHMRRFPPASRVRSEVRIGSRVADPVASLIIPLYRNLNFLGFQQAAFARDPIFRDLEIVYVLDSPEQEEFLEGRLRGEHLIYGLPSVIAVHSENLGFAPSVNTGANIARGRTLIFLNSDVVPESAGWVEPLLSALDRPGIGAAGSKLLYTDDSLQFAGLYFDRSTDGYWFNRHIAKGFPRSHPDADRPRVVPGLTGACLAVRRKTFERVDGFDEGFVIGDFEDSDFSLRLNQAGLACWYEPRSVLYHIERQSIEYHDAHGKSAATMVNRWRQERLWADRIAVLMEDAESRWRVPPGFVPRIERFE